MWLAMFAGVGSASAQDNRTGRLTFGPHPVGFRAVCDTAGRAAPDREQLLIWYPAKATSAATPLRFSEYLAPARHFPCGDPPATAEQRQAALDALARQLASIDSFPGEPASIGGRFFSPDSAPAIARRLAATMTRAYPSAEPVAGNFPVVVAAHAGAMEQSVLIESLASHGYVVVSFPHRGRGGVARQGVDSGAERDLVMAHEIGRAIDAAVRAGHADGSRVAVIANAGFIPGAIWFEAQSDRLSALIMKGGRIPGALPAIGAPAGTRTPAVRATDERLPTDLAQTWRVPMLDWQWAGNPYTRGVLETFNRAERIHVAEQVGHPNSDGMRRLVNPADTIASTANDAFGAYVQRFLAYALEGQAGASAYFDRTAETNGVLPGLLAVRRSRPDSSEEVTRPSPRHHHAITYDPSRGRVMLFAGYSVDTAGRAVVLDDLWSWNGEQWDRIADSTGAPMVGHVLFAHEVGGLFTRGGPRGLTGRWDGRQWVVVSEDTGTRRGGAASAYHARRQRQVLFGGSTGPGRVVGETWEFDGRTWTRVATDGPAPRMMASMVYDVQRDVMVMFGGWDPSTRTWFGDTWEWDGVRWDQVATGGPSARSEVGMVYDPLRRVTMLFGGLDSLSRRQMGDTWLWDGREWRQLDLTGPSPRAEPFMAFDAGRGVTVMFGGWGRTPGRSLGDTWEWDGERWTRRSSDESE